MTITDPDSRTARRRQLRGAVTTDTTAHGRSKKKIAAFKIDRTEVTVAAYRACVEAKTCTAPVEDKDGANENCNFGYKNRADHPVTCVSSGDAATYCKYVGGRLPTRDEWLYAATGGDANNYPWGATAPTQGVCWSGGNKSIRSSCRVDSSASDVSPFKVVDAAGNVQEWVVGLSPGTFMGGDFDTTSPEDLKPAYEGQRPGPWGYNYIGFRCAK